MRGENRESVISIPPATGQNPAIGNKKSSRRSRRIDQIVTENNADHVAFAVSDVLARIPIEPLPVRNNFLLFPRAPGFRKLHGIADFFRIRMVKPIERHALLSPPVKIRPAPQFGLAITAAL